MPVGFTEALPPADAEAVKRTEAALGVEIPREYVAFLGEQNGGYLDENVLPPGDDASVEYLYSAGPNDDPYVSSLEEQARSYSPETDPRIRTGFLPIGEDGGGNIICLRAAGEDYSAVYFWTHDAAENDDAYERIADSWTDFWDALRPYP